MAMTEVIWADGTHGLEMLSLKETGGLPVPVPSAILLQVKSRAKMLSRRIALFLVLLIGTAAAGWWWLQPDAAVPPGIASSTGQLKAVEIDIVMKLAGRIGDVTIDVGDMVHTGQIVARMDTRALEAQLAQAPVGVQQADHNLTAARAALDQQRTVLAWPR